MKGGDAALAAHVERSIEKSARRYVGLVAGVARGAETAIVAAGRTGAGTAAPDERTVFQIGSVTKVFTALLLGEAVRRGEVTLDQPLASLLPVSSRRRTRPITLLDLATHSSGLPRLPPGISWQSVRQPSDPYRRFTADDLATALARAPRRPPGERVRYSNFGFAALGEGLSRAAGAPFGELVVRRVCAPLEMDDSGLATGGQALVASGHSARGKPVGRWHFGAMAAAGGLQSSARDLLRLVRAHARPEESAIGDAIRMVVQPRARVNESLRICLGWHLTERAGRGSVLWHNGGTRGFFALVALDRREERGVVVLTNTGRSVDRIGFDLLRATRNGR